MLTHRAVDRLAEADFVLYDALTRPEALALAPRAQKISVGKRHGRHSVSQETINRLLVRGARRGKRVVRLKCGDPFVFGRGGEEALALAHAGIPFEVVPGVSSAVAAPALAGIPVTHRGLASGVRRRLGPRRCGVDAGRGWPRARSATLVVLMGVTTRHRLAARLIERGWPAIDAGRAALRRRRRPDASTWIGPLAELAADEAIATRDESHEGPGTIVIGDVVGLAYTLAGLKPGATSDSRDEASPSSMSG